MKILTTRDLIRTVAARWRKQYPVNTRLSSDETDTDSIGDKLRALNVETAGVADVGAIIGNTTWTRLVCKECDSDVSRVLVLEDSRSFVDESFPLCPACVTKAFSLWSSQWILP